MLACWARFSHMLDLKAIITSSRSGIPAILCCMHTRHYIHASKQLEIVLNCISMQEIYTYSLLQFIFKDYLHIIQETGWLFEFLNIFEYLLQTWWVSLISRQHICHLVSCSCMIYAQQQSLCCRIP